MPPSANPSRPFSQIHTPVLRLPEAPLLANRSTVDALPTSANPATITFLDHLLSTNRNPTIISPTKRQRAPEKNTRKAKQRITQASRSKQPQVPPLTHATPDSDYPDFEIDDAGLNLDNTILQGDVDSAGTTHEDDRYEEYIDSTLSAALGFYRVSSTLYIVQGWDVKTGFGTVRLLWNIGSTI